MKHTTRLAGALVAALLAAHASAQEIQPAPLITEDMPVEIGSGPVSNEGRAERVIFSDRVFIPGAMALRLRFDEVELSGFVSDGSGSYLRMTSLFDGGQQRLNAQHVEQWGYTSAYFNGDEVLVELVAQPGTGVNELSMSTVMAQFELFVDESICGPTDDRVPSTDNRAARLLPVGCSGWMINDCNHCFITAGHCSTSNNSVQVVEFNVPLSNSNGSINHPPPEDQYAADSSSRQSNNGQGVGNDYAYFGVFPNSNTGLTPFETYGETYELATPPPAQGQPIRITGYGTTGNGVPREWNQAQKTHVGPFFSFNGTSISYQTDTTGGNSGSPVIDDTTGFAIGVHTHGGCGGNSGNWGTGYNHPGLQAYLANPQGVCECPTLTFFYPDGLPEVVDPNGTSTVRLEVLGNGDSVPEPGTGVFYYDLGTGFQSVSMTELADNVYEATFPEAPCGTDVRFYFSADATDGTTVTDPEFAPSNSYETFAAVEYALVADDDFQEDSGFTVQNDPDVIGGWQRGDPFGNSGGSPMDDYDGSGRCYVTGNGFPIRDLDGGTTRLISPIYDLSGLTNPTIGYARWFHNSSPEDGDELVVEISDDFGVTWVEIERVGHQGNEWVPVSHILTDFVDATNGVVIRFSASDQGADSLTEAGIDALLIQEVDCGDTCVADFNGDGDVNTLDVLEYLNAYAAGDPSADINGDGEVNTIDVLEFLNAWTAGC